MAVKYSVQYRDSFNQVCRVDIAKESYSGDATILRGVAKNACVITRDCSDDPYDTVINTKASINFYQTDTSAVDVEELQLATDREFAVQFYIGADLKFSGFMIADGIIKNFKGTPYEVNITAVDGLNLLEGIPYNHDNLTGGRCVINYLRRILFSTANLGNPLPIEWVNTLTNSAYPLETDIFSGSVAWAPFGDGFYEIKEGQTIYKSCRYIVEYLLKAMQCRIVQDNGIWKVQRINDIVSGAYTVNTTPASLTGFAITSSSKNVNKTILGKADSGDYSFIEENATLAVLPALKQVTTTYTQDQRKNIIPNGDMDIVSLSRPFYWVTSSASTSVVSDNSLYDRFGSSAKVYNFGATESKFLLAETGKIPIDTKVLYKTFNFGFKFLLETGTVDGSGLIVWASTLVKFKITYNDGTYDYYLNEFGFWEIQDGRPPRRPDYITVTVDQLKLNEVAQIDFNKFQNIKLPTPLSYAGLSNNPSLKLEFYIQPSQIILLEDVYFNVVDLQESFEAINTASKNTAKEEYDLKISSSHNGFYVSNFMSGFWNSGAEKFYNDAKTTSATLTSMNSQAIMRYRYLPSQIFEGSIYAANYSYGEIYTIKTLTGKKFLPLKSTWNTETNTVSLTCVEARDGVVTLDIKQNGIDYGD